MKRLLYSVGLSLIVFVAALDSRAAAAEPSADIAAREAALRSAAEATRLTAVKALRQYGGSVKPMVQALITALNDKSPDVRAYAARGLCDIGPSARMAVPALIPLLNDKSDDVRLASAEALGEIGVVSEEALCGLGSLLHDSNANVRGRAALALSRFGKAAELHRVDLLELLNDENPDTAINAALALASTGEPVPQAGRFYALALTHEDYARKVAEEALKKIGAPGVSALIDVIQNEKEMYLKQAAVSTLNRFGEDARPAIPVLTAALNNSDVELQNRAARVLLEFDVAPIEASAALLRLMENGGECRKKALAAFERMGEPAADVPLATLKAKVDASLRQQAARVLVVLAPRFKENPEALGAGLSDPDETVRVTAIEAIAKCGAEHKKVVGCLIPLLSDKMSDVAWQACKVLNGMCDDPAAVMALANTRLHGAPAVKNEAGRGVAACGANALPALAIVRSGLKSDDVYAREWSTQVIGNLGPAASDAVPDLLECLIKLKPSRSDVAHALGKVGEKSIAALLPLLKDSDAGIRSAVALALGDVGPPALNELMAATVSSKVDVAEAACAALGRMVPTSAAAIPALLAVLPTKVGRVREAAGDTLGKLGMPAATALIAELKNADETRRPIYVSPLCWTGGKAVPIIVDALQHEQDSAVICWLVESLGRMGPAASDAVPLILEIAGRPFAPKDREQVWAHCATALGTIGAARETAVPVLFGMLSAEGKGPHSSAAAALRLLGSENLRVPPLADALKNAWPSNVGNALRPFGRGGMLQLVAEMQSGTPEIRDAAASAFVQLAPECLPFLVQTLDEGATGSPASIGVILAIGEVRSIEIDKRAVKSTPPKPLEELQKALELCMPALQKKIQSGNADEAVAALWAVGKKWDNGVDSIAKNLAICAPDLRARGTAALNFYDLHGQSRTLAPVLPILLKECGVAAGPVRAKNVAALNAAGYCSESAPALADALEDSNSNVRTTALAAFKIMGPAGQPAIPKLIQLLESTTPYVAAGASVALTNVGEKAAPALIAAMGSDSLKIRTAAFEILSAMKLSGYTDALVQAAGDERQEVCSHALQLIANLKEEGRPAEAKVRSLLGSDNDLVFQESVKTLTKMGVNVFGALAKIAEGPNVLAALRATKQMHLIPPVDAGTIHEFVKKTLKNENAEVRASVVLLLAGKGASAQSMPVIAEALKDTYSMTRVNAMVWLFDNGPFAPDVALPLALAELKDPYETASTVAMNTLMFLKEKARPAIPELKKLLNDPARRTRVSAATVLVKLGENDPAATLIYNESNIAARVEEYHEKQERYFEEHFTDENVHHFAATYMSVLGTGKDLPVTEGADGMAHYSGYVLKILTTQSLRAEGGQKDWSKKGVLVTGHALLAWPAEPGISGRIAYMSGPDGAIYERAVKVEDAPKFAEIAAAFDPGPEWKKTYTPAKVPRAIPHSYFHPTEKTAEQMEF